VVEAAFVADYVKGMKEIRLADNVEETIVEATLGRLDRATLDRMAEAAREVLDIQARLNMTGDNVVGELIKNAGTFFEWDHYPDGDVYDAHTGGQYFYHAHPADLRVGEHGHFHTFLRPAGMPDGIRPATVADYTAPDDANDALSHIIGIAMNEFGAPICLFTTNRWVTGETWYAGADVARMVDLFEINHTQPSWPVSRWLSAMLRLFRPQILRLIADRDAAVEAWSRAGKAPDGNVLEDRVLEVTSYCRISIETQARLIDAALETPTSGS
jgi:hypothetical protein